MGAHRIYRTCLGTLVSGLPSSLDLLHVCTCRTTGSILLAMPVHLDPVVIHVVILDLYYSRSGRRRRGANFEGDDHHGLLLLLLAVVVMVVVRVPFPSLGFAHFLHGMVSHGASRLAVLEFVWMGQVHETQGRSDRDSGSDGRMLSHFLSLLFLTFR